MLLRPAFLVTLLFPDTHIRPLSHALQRSRRVICTPSAACDFSIALGLPFLQCFAMVATCVYPILLEIIFLMGPELAPCHELPALSPWAPPSAATHSKGSLGSALWSSGGMGILL